MFRTRWIHKLFTRQHRRPTAKPRKPVRLRLEPLEERLTPHADPTTCVAGNAAINFYGHGHSPEFVIPVAVKDNAGGACDSGRHVQRKIGKLRKIGVYTPKIFSELPLLPVFP